MKLGKNLVDLAQEIERRRGAKKDFIADTSKIEAGVIEKDGKANVVLRMSDHELAINPLAHVQIGEHVGIPKKYYDRMLKDDPILLATNINTWFRREPDKRLIRTLDSKARAFLSQRYRPLENEDLLEAVLPVLGDLGVEVMSCDVTETRLYIKAVDPRIHRDVPKGHAMGDGTHTFFDTCSPAVIVKNSEVGLGAMDIEAGMFTKVCTNLAMFSDRGFKKYHVGGKLADLGDQVYAMLSDQTRRISDAALWSQVRDVTKIAFDEAAFGKIVDEKIIGMSKDKIDGDPVKVVELTSRKFGLNEREQSSVLKHLIQGGDLSRYGVFNAITRTAQDLDDYDRASEFEALGGKVIELPRNEWQQIAEAA